MGNSTKLIYFNFTPVNLNWYVSDCSIWRVVCYSRNACNYAAGCLFQLHLAILDHLVGSPIQNTTRSHVMPSRTFLWESHTYKPCAFCLQFGLPVLYCRMWWSSHSVTPILVFTGSFCICLCSENSRVSATNNLRISNLAQTIKLVTSFFYTWALEINLAHSWWLQWLQCDAYPTTSYSRWPTSALCWRAMQSVTDLPRRNSPVPLLLVRLHYRIFRAPQPPLRTPYSLWKKQNALGKN
jgi:hypothetical protein